MPFNECYLKPLYQLYNHSDYKTNYTKHLIHLVYLLIQQHYSMVVFITQNNFIIDPMINSEIKQCTYY